MAKPPANRTKYDTERAHLMTLATDGNRTALATTNRRKISLPGQINWSQRHFLGAKMGENMVSEVYNGDLIEASPNMVELRRKRSIAVGVKAYKFIKGATLPRR